MQRYACILKGGSIGESRDRKTPIFDTKEEAQEHGKRYVRSFSGGSRNYYRPGYSVRKISVKEEAEIQCGNYPWWMRI